MINCISIVSMISIWRCLVITTSINKKSNGFPVGF
jgi:hypothetical protein